MGWNMGFPNPINMGGKYISTDTSVFRPTFVKII